MCVYVCRSARKTEKIRTEEDEDGKGQEGNGMKEVVEEEREAEVATMREKSQKDGTKGGEREEKTVGEGREWEKTFSHCTNELR